MAKCLANLTNFKPITDQKTEPGKLYFLLHAYVRDMKVDKEIITLGK